MTKKRSEPRVGKKRFVIRPGHRVKTNHVPPGPSDEEAESWKKWHEEGAKGNDDLKEVK